MDDIHLRWRHTALITGWAAVILGLGHVACSGDAPERIDVGVGDEGAEVDADVGTSNNTDLIGDTKGDYLDVEDVSVMADVNASSEPDDAGDSDVSGDVSPDVGPEQEAGFPFDWYCYEAVDGQVSFDFEIATSTSSYTVIPFSLDEQGWIDPQKIATPSGATIDFYGDNFFQLYGLEYPEIQWINAITIPAAPKFEDQLESGNHTMEVHTEVDEVCYYLIETSGMATEIDFNIYFVGLDDIGLNAQTAETHDDFQSVLSSFEQMYEQVGLSLGEIRYVELAQPVVDAYRVIHDEWDIYELLAHSTYPGADVDSALSVNLFITERFVYEPVGLSMGIPGIPGYHASLVSGVALTGEYIGDNPDDNLFTAVAMAHEVGHFLGLFHTSEADGQSHDNLDDTPECYDFDQIWDCPDGQNVMFPFIHYDTTELSSDQGSVLHVNPLTK